MTLREIMLSKSFIRSDGLIQSFEKLDDCDDIFKIVVDYLHCSVIKGLDFSRPDGISALTCEFYDEYCETMFCIFVRGVCNAIEPLYICYLIDCYEKRLYASNNDDILNRVALLSFLLKRIVLLSNLVSQIDFLLEMISLSSMLSSSELSWYCYQKLNETVAKLKEKGH